MTNTILVINAGSSSIKFHLFDIAGAGALRARLNGQIAGIGTAHPKLSAKILGSGRQTQPAQEPDTFERTIAPDHAADVTRAQEVVGAWLSEHLGGLPTAVGHRVVHGGPDFTGPARIDDAVLAKLESYVHLAPLHQPNNLAPIRAIRARQPGMAQVACFDTAFHRGHAATEDRYALPESLHAQGIRRYGFHGLSYEYISRQMQSVLPALASGKVVVAHLGSGASACAIDQGRSVSSTMGFSTLDGLPMGTRPGRLDAGAVLWLMQQGMNAHAIENLLYHDCGLLGLSGISGDARDLEASSDPRAQFALDYFARRTAEEIAALGCAMNGLDGVVFTAGIGENSPSMRAAIASHWQWLGAKIDPGRNARNALQISADDSRIGLYVLPTDEDRIIAQHTLDLIA